MASTYWVETLGCPKNQVDSDKLTGKLAADGLAPARSAGEADLVVVNTCAFIEAARQESIDTVLALADAKREGARIVVTGCMAERYGDELAAALPEVDRVAGFGVSFDEAPIVEAAAPPAGGAAAAPNEVAVSIGSKPRAADAVVPAFDLLNLPRPRSAVPWAYVKIAEGCDRRCGFCAIPSFRGRQRSRSVASLLDEVRTLEVKEIVLVAQDLASYGRDDPSIAAGAIVGLVQEVAALVERTRLLYLYPSDLSDELIEVIGAVSGVAYYDLSLQHVSKPLLRRMRRWGDGGRFLARIADIRSRFPHAAFRSNFIVGYPGETERDHDQLIAFIEEADLDWVGFFAYSKEDGTHAATLDGTVPQSLVRERLRELTELQDGITARKRRDLVGTRVDVLVDRPGRARSHREAPEIDGIIAVPEHLAAGQIHNVEISAAFGPDLEAC